MSDMTTMTDKSIQREELAELRKLRDLMKRGQLVDITALDLDKLDVESEVDDASENGSDHTDAGASAEEEEEEEDEWRAKKGVEEEEVEKASGDRGEGANKVYGSSSDVTDKGSGPAEESGTQESQAALTPAPSDGVNVEVKMATGDG